MTGSTIAAVLQDALESGATVTLTTVDGRTRPARVVRVLDDGIETSGRSGLRALVPFAGIAWIGLTPGADPKRVPTT